MARDLVRLEGGMFLMGSTDFYPEEGPVVRATVAPFEIARTAVTNAEFAAFVDATGYLTVAECPLNPGDIPGLENIESGSLVFVRTSGPVRLDDWRQWWQWMPGASWRHPYGPDSDILDKPDHPVVQVCFEDATAYAEWAQCRLPTEAEWEFAARGGLHGARFAWGDTTHSAENLLANTWQGRFPYENTGTNGWVDTAPVGSFPANGYGLFDMTGNTWEWTSERWTPQHTEPGSSAIPPCGCGCGPDDRVAARTMDAAGLGESAIETAQRVLKGGSHLCAPEYCLRYRPAARSPQTEDSAATHIGVRVARSV